MSIGPCFGMMLSPLYEVTYATVSLSPPAPRTKSHIQGATHSGYFMYVLDTWDLTLFREVILWALSSGLHQNLMFSKMLPGQTTS